ncbi:Protein RcsF [Rhodovastum atsumiense]|uniref:DUF1045 domain-containing protein n=1 Tax=Rhodovastum atsumiense TaxID=504468 RepID=UPI001EF12969|nr:DUF1045 domain-containing protein [Rhodovastum atsumiense]CAH2604062.1 Protein RcsF [Rhodovastum atsumiense]
MAQPDLPDIAAVTAEPRLYGFHATLKPPMRLRDGAGRDDLLAVARAIAAAAPAFDLPPLEVAAPHGFLALRESRPCPPLQALADAAVAWADPLRAPPDAAELARRRGSGLPPAAEANLRRWGYPYVFATWFFHLTLTRRLSSAEHALYRPAAEAHFADVLALPRRVSEICLFAQPTPGAAFILDARISLAG